MTTYLPLDVTSGQRKNLETLYTFLGTADSRYFHMAEFAVPAGEDPKTANSIDIEDLPDVTCGTICCMVGHGPRAGFSPDGFDTWTEYGHAYFGALPRHSNADASANPVWDWLFSNEWAYTDNTLAGGRARLRLALDQGIPSDYREQLYGDTPYIFAELANG